MTAPEFVVDSSLTIEQIDRRITFIDDLQIMEADFSDLQLHTPVEVNQFYDRLEDRIAETGEELWFFLVNYSNCRIDPEAWWDYSRRGKTLNLAHSMGSVRYDATEATRRQIERDAGTERFDANLFTNRDSALERIKTFKSKRIKKIIHEPNYTRADFEPRVSFIEDARIMDIDLSDITFFHSKDVDDFYDFLQEKLEATGRRWYYLINYNNCQIMPEAWVQWAQRGKAFNIAGSEGTVRYEAGQDTEEEIRMRAQSQDFRPNILRTREDALARIDQMKRDGY